MPINRLSNKVPLKNKFSDMLWCGVSAPQHILLFSQSERDGPSLYNAKPINKTFFVYLQSFFRIIGQMIYGATIYEMVRDLRKERAQLEHLFILVVFGEFLGIPILPPYFSMRLLPYIIPSIDNWKISMLKERDLVDCCNQEFS